MPNWVANKVKIEGPNKAKILKSLLVRDEYQELRFDFNKIVPMPKTLDIPSSTEIDKCIKLFMHHLYYNGDEEFEKYMYASIQGRNKKFELASDKEYTETMKSLLESYDYETNKKRFKSEKDVFKLGKQALDNVINYGFQDWYDWSIANWGTKWNSCHVEQVSDDTVHFDTAWSNVRDLIYKLSLKYPNNTFLYSYSEEDIGVQVGEFEVKNGVILSEKIYKDFSKEAYEFAFDMWGDEIRKNYKFNEKTGNYEYYESEEDEEME